MTLMYFLYTANSVIHYVIFIILIILAWVELDIHFDFFFQIYQREDIGSNSSTIHLLTSSTLMMTEDTTIKSAGIVINVYGALLVLINKIAGITVAGIPLKCNRLH